MYRTITITHPSGLIEKEYANRTVSRYGAIDIGMLALTNYTSDPERPINLLFTVKNEEGVVEYTSSTYTTITHECGSRQFMIAGSTHHICTWCGATTEDDSPKQWTPTYDDRFGLVSDLA